MFDVVNHAKILGVTVSNNLLWNNHINDVIRKANKRLYFIALLKRARLPPVSDRSLSTARQFFIIRFQSA